MGTSRGLTAALAVTGTLLLGGCGGDDDSSDARDAAVDWAERVAAGDRAACKVSTERGGALLAGFTGGLACEEFAGGRDDAELLAGAFLVDSTSVLAGGLADAENSEVVDAQGETVQRFTFEPADAVTVEVDLLEQDGRWLVNDFRTIPDPLGGDGSEAIDEAAIDGLDQSDADAVRVRWAELVAAKDPSACLLYDPSAVYALIVRAPGVDSCSELVTSGLQLHGQRGEQLVEGAKAAVFAGEPIDADDRDLEVRRYSAQLDDGSRYAFNLALVDGSWRLRSLSSGSVDVIIGGKSYGGQ